MTPIPHPDTQSLLDAIAHLRSELAALLTQAHELLHTVKPNLLAMYQTKLGAWELSLLRAQWTVARHKRTVELVQSALNRGQKPDMVAITSQVETELIIWQVKLKEATDKLSAAQQRLEHLMPTEDSKELKKLYFALVKQLHPDLHPEQDAAAQQLWQQVQEAYDASDLEKLRAFTLLHPPQQTGTDEPKSEQKLRALKDLVIQRIGEAQKRIATLEAQPPFTLREQLENESWIAARRAEIEAQLAPLQEKAAALEQHLQTLVSQPSLPHVPGEFGSN